jgi:hypothetical protein
MGQTWTGLSADAANRRFDTTLKEFQNAQVEAKSIASLLRDAHTQLEVARIGAVGDTGNRTGTGLGDHGVATLCDH